MAGRFFKAICIKEQKDLKNYTKQKEKKIAYFLLGLVIIEISMVFIFYVKICKLSMNQDKKHRRALKRLQYNLQKQKQPRLQLH